MPNAQLKLDEQRKEMRTITCKVWRQYDMNFFTMQTKSPYLKFEVLCLQASYLESALRSMQSSANTY